MTDMTREDHQARHLATVSHEGRFWDVYLEVTEDTGPRPCRARLRYSPADPSSGGEPVRTTTILIEQTFEDVVSKARGFGDHHLIAMLRSALPD